MSWLFTAANLAWWFVALLSRLCAAAASVVKSDKAEEFSKVSGVETGPSEVRLPVLTRDETLLDASTAADDNPADRETSDFVKFVQDTVIPEFFRQRDKGHSEFAVLILPKADSLSGIGRIDLLPRKPRVKRKQPLYPTVNQGHVNYIVARPDQDNHCEATLLRHLPALWSTCKRKAGYTPTHIVLYTWIQPCAGCTAAILRSLSAHPASTLAPPNVVVAYTVRWKRISDEENAANKSRLVDSGIRVIRVKYAVDL